MTVQILQVYAEGADVAIARAEDNKGGNVICGDSAHMHHDSSNLAMANRACWILLLM